MSSIEPTPERFQEFMAGPAGQPIVMINLLRYRDEAAYPDGYAAEPCSGREAYERYSALVVPLLTSVGGRLRWLGTVASTVIAPDAESWDDAILVEYPSRQAFLEMVSKPEYQAAVVHRSAALADSRLIATHSGPVDAL